MKGCMPFQSNRKKSRSGFSLTELVIVLGVIGLVSAAIWGASNVVRSKEHIQETVQTVIDISTRVRSVYSGHPNAPGMPLDTASQIQGGLFPLNAMNPAQTATINAWGGAFEIVFPAAAPRYGFSVQINIPATLALVSRQEVCLDLLTRLPASATNYIGGTNDVLPAADVVSQPQQGTGPSLAFVNRSGTWTNVTGQSGGQILAGLGNDGCLGVAFYYKL